MTAIADLTHARRAIREGIGALLRAGGTHAGTRVYVNPFDPRAAFPALMVEDQSEDQAAPNLPGGERRRIERRLQLDVVAEVRQSSQYARERDDLLAQVEALLSAATSVQVPGAKSITPAGCVFDLDVRAETPVCIGRQRYSILYYTTAGAPDVTL